MLSGMLLFNKQVQEIILTCSLMVLPKLRAGKFQGLTDFLLICSFMSPNSWFYCSSKVEVIRVGTHSHPNIAIVVPSPYCLPLRVDSCKVPAYFWKDVRWGHREVWVVDAFGRVGPATQYVAGLLHIDCWTQKSASATGWSYSRKADSQ